jgi:hypothetical protein
VTRILTLDGGGNIGVVEFGYYTDVLSGGLGADKFVFSSIDDIGNSTIVGRAADLITDFSPRVDNGPVDLSADGDQINLHPIDADERPSAPGNEDFSRDLIPEGEAFTAPGQISWLHQEARRGLRSTRTPISPMTRQSVSPGRTCRTRPGSFFDGNDARRSTKRLWEYF